VPLFVEQLYPFPDEELTSLLALYKQAKDIIWCQEEPENQGAWYSIQHNIRACLSKDQSLVYVGRAASASPAVGYRSVHLRQQEELVKQALNIK